MPDQNHKIDHSIDNAINIVTPENISFSYRVAGPVRRLLAFIIDLCLRALILMLMMLLGLLVIMLAPPVGIFYYAFSIVSFFLISWFYGGLFETFWNGQTPGKWMLGIRVLSGNGSPINGMQAVMRNILREAEMYPTLPLVLFFYPASETWLNAFIVPTFGVGLIAMWVTRRYQRLGDLVCNTVVVMEERSWLMGVAKLEDPRAAQLATYLPPNYEVSRSLARALAIYVERRRFFSRPRRREIARHLGAPLLIEFELPADTSHDLLLCALYYRTFIAEAGQEIPEGDNPFAQGPPIDGERSKLQEKQYVLPPLPQEQMVGMGPNEPRTP